MDPNRSPESEDLSIERCPHCCEITLRSGNHTIELSRDSFMRFRDLVNEVAMDLPDRGSIYNPSRFENLKN